MSTYFLKRPIDVVASTAVLALLSPVLLGIGAWVRLTSPGPALFRQPRVGRNQETFEILKFRTMVDRPSTAIDQVQEAVVTGGRDERITRAGRILRASSLDELPQLVNILRGEMSLIGPRPVIPDQLSAVPTTHLDRFAVRPGLTGLAQVSGRRGLDWLDQLAFDSEYVQRCSLWLDIRIVLRTLAVVTRGSGVYGGRARMRAASSQLGTCLLVLNLGQISLGLLLPPLGLRGVLLLLGLRLVGHPAPPVPADGHPHGETVL